MKNTKGSKTEEQIRKAEPAIPELPLNCSCTDEPSVSAAGCLLVLVLSALLVNCVLCFLGKADAHELSERLGAVFYAGCGALIRNWYGKNKKED